jgi:hypothetical protein
VLSLVPTLISLGQNSNRWKGSLYLPVQHAVHFYRPLVSMGTLYVLCHGGSQSKYVRPNFKCAKILKLSSLSEQAVCSAGRVHHSSSKAHPYRGQPGARVPPGEHGAGSVPGHNGFVPSKSCGNASEGEKSS